MNAVEFTNPTGQERSIKVYHTSPFIIEHPDTLHSREALDFGRGFYVTTLRQQAVDYGRRFTRVGQQAFVNEYILNERFHKDFRVKVFHKYDEEWLDYILACRRCLEVKRYDCLIGGIANDRIFNTINLYIDGLLSKQDTLDRLIYEKPNVQLCICNQLILDHYLTFLTAQEI